MSTKSADLSALSINRSTEDRPSGNKKPPWKLVTVLLTIAIVSLTYFAFKDRLISVPEVELTTVSLTYPSQENAVLTASGYVVAQQKASVASKGTGRLVFLGVEEGDRVSKGQIIARLEDSDVIAELEKARADLEFAIADSVEASKSFQREQTLHQRNLSSTADFDLAAARIDKVIASVKGARASVAAAQVSLENTRIRAPFDGTVLTKNADVGEVVAPFASSVNSRGAVVTMADMSSLEVEADVSESNITRVRIGQPCEIALDAYPEIRYQGFVHKVVPTADRAKATVLTKVRFKQKDERVLPEMSAKVLFLEREVSNNEQQNIRPLLTVPTSSIVLRGNSSVAFAVHDNQAEIVPVKTGKTVGSRIEIIAGLSAGDKIILRPPSSLGSGDEIRMKSN